MAWVGYLALRATALMQAGVPSRVGTSACAAPASATKVSVARSQRTIHAPGRPREARISVSCQLGSPDRPATTDATRQRLHAADGGMRVLSGSTSKPMPPPVSAASCRRRAAVRSGGGPSSTSTAPATAGERRASSNAHNPSFGRLAPTQIKSARHSQNSASPFGQMSGSCPIQITEPAARARRSAQKPTAAPRSTARTSWKAARVSSWPGSARSMAGQIESPDARIATLPVFNRAIVARSAARAACRSDEG